MMNPSPTFCPLPWMHVFVAADGIFYPCCRSVDAQTPNVDHLGKPQRFHSGESIVTAWNSDFMRAVRTDMLAGRRPPACAGCFAVEDLGGESDRQMINRLYPQYVREALSAAVDDGRIECKPRTLDLRVGNICNLQCRMCSPRLSKGLLNEFKMLHGLSDDSEYVRSASRPSWFESETATLTALLQKEDAYWRPRATDHQVTEFKDKIRTIIAFMNQIDRSDGVNEFLRRNEFHDSYRGQDSLRLIPELAEIAAWAERRTPKSRSPRAANK